MSALKAPTGVLEAIAGRRSVRAYADQAVDRPTVQALLDAAVRAPTAMHEEPWMFLVIQDRSVLTRLSDRAKPLFAAQVRQSRTRHSFDAFLDPAFNVFYDAGTLIVICTDRAGSFVAADCWLAAENLMLAAYGRGLGSCVIGSAVAALNLPEVKAELGLPEPVTAWS